MYLEDIVSNKKLKKNCLGYYPCGVADVGSGAPARKIEQFCGNDDLAIKSFWNVNFRATLEKTHRHVE